MLGVANLPGHTISPLGLSRFTECFLAPVVAAHLIVQDLGCDIKLGHQLMLASGTVGDVLHPYEPDQEDDEIDTVLQFIGNMGHGDSISREKSKRRSRQCRGA